MTGVACERGGLPSAAKSLLRARGRRLRSGMPSFNLSLHKAAYSNHESFWPHRRLLQNLLRGEPSSPAAPFQGKQNAWPMQGCLENGFKLPGGWSTKWHKTMQISVDTSAETSPDKNASSSTAACLFASTIELAPSKRLATNAFSEILGFTDIVLPKSFFNDTSPAAWRFDAAKTR